MALRQVIVALVMVVLALAGVGRGGAAASDTAPNFGIPGVASPICHAGGGDRSPPVDQGHHDCCDACALAAPANLADAPSLAAPVPVVHLVAHARAMAWVPSLARFRTPRQSQGPPAA